jgi:uncharacterized DUF497 family protein
MKFEWDRNKAQLNQQKHQVAFEEAITVFLDPMARIFDDEWHSVDELREIIIGYSNQNRLLIVCFTEREEAVRIISSREATKRERKKHEENIYE